MCSIPIAFEELEPGERNSGRPVAPPTPDVLGPFARWPFKNISSQRRSSVSDEPVRTAETSVLGVEISPSGRSTRRGSTRFQRRRGRNRSDERRKVRRHLAVSSSPIRVLAVDQESCAALCGRDQTGLPEDVGTTECGYSLARGTVSQIRPVDRSAQRFSQILVEPRPPLDESSVNRLRHRESHSSLAEVESRKLVVGCWMVRQQPVDRRIGTVFELLGKQAVPREAGKEIDNAGDATIGAPVEAIVGRGDCLVLIRSRDLREPEAHLGVEADVVEKSLCGKRKQFPRSGPYGGTARLGSNVVLPDRDRQGLRSGRLQLRPDAGALRAKAPRRAPRRRSSPLSSAPVRRPENLTLRYWRRRFGEGGYR